MQLQSLRDFPLQPDILPVHGRNDLPFLSGCCLVWNFQPVEPIMDDVTLHPDDILIAKSYCRNEER